MNRDMDREDRFEKALRSVKPLDSLRTLSLELSAEGYPKPQIVEFFEQHLSQLQSEPSREEDADAVRDLLDFLVGWCSPHMKLLHEEGDISSVPPL